MEQQNDAEKPMDLKGLMDFLGIGRNSALKLLGSGEVPAVRIGKGWRVSKAAVIEWLNKGTNQRGKAGK